MMMQTIFEDSYSFDAIVIVRYKYFTEDYETNLKQLQELFKQIEKRRYN